MGSQFPVSTTLNPTLFYTPPGGNTATHSMSEAEAKDTVGEMLVNYSSVQFKSGAPYPAADGPFQIYSTTYQNGVNADEYRSTQPGVSGFTEFYQGADGPARRLSTGTNQNDGLLHLDEGLRKGGVFQKTRGYTIDVNDGVVWPEGQPKPKPTPPTQTAGTDLG